MPSKPQGHDTRYHKMQKNNCFVCGQNNREGMRLKFILDEQRQTFVCRFRLSKRYTGPPGHAHGGIIASILDDAMGKVNKLHHVVALTRGGPGADGRASPYAHADASVRGGAR